MENGNMMNNNGANENGGKGKQPKESLIVRGVKAVKRTYLSVKQTKAGKVVIYGTKGALMGLGLVKVGELIGGCRKPADETVSVVVTPVMEAEAPVEEIPAEEAADEDVVADEQE